MKMLLLTMMILSSISAFAKDQACLRMVVEAENFSIVSDFLKSNKIEFKLQSNHSDSTLMFKKGSTLTVFTSSTSEVKNRLIENDIIQSMNAEKFPCGMYKAAADIRKL
jgi:hypothetical protein